MKKLLGFLLLSLIMILSATGLTACGCSGCGSNDKGTYYKYSDGNYDKNDYVILDGSHITFSDGLSGTYEIKDGKIYLYVMVLGSQFRISGTIKNGVMIIEKQDFLVSQDEIFCKEGCSPCS